MLACPRPVRRDPPRLADRVTRGGPGASQPTKCAEASHAAYEDLVLEELSYKCEVMDAAIGVLNTLPVSTMRDAYLALEAESQRVWRRREQLHASDLVRFGRVSWVWRNDQVDQLDADRRLDSQLRALANPQVAREMASNAGTREVARATVASLNPMRLIVHSRRIGDESTIHVAHSPAGPSVDLPETALKTLMGSFKLNQQPVGVLEADEQTEVDGSLLWHFKVCPELKVGDDLVVLDGEWIGATFKSGHEISIARPSLDQTSAPKATCEEGTTSTTRMAIAGAAVPTKRARPTRPTGSQSVGRWESSTRRSGRRWSTKTSSTRSRRAPPPRVTRTATRHAPQTP